MKTIIKNLQILTLVILVNLNAFSQYYVSEEETTVPTIITSGTATDYADEGREVAIVIEIKKGSDYVSISPENVNASGPPCPTYDEDGRHPPVPPDPTVVTKNGSITLTSLPAAGTTEEIELKGTENGGWVTCTTGEAHGWDPVTFDFDIICIDVIITKTNVRTDKKTGILTIDCEAEGYTGAGAYFWQIGNKSATGKSVSVVFEPFEWNFREGQQFPVKVKYLEGGVGAYDETTVKTEGLPFSVTIFKAEHTVNKRTGELTINCVAVGSPIGGEYTWDVNGKNAMGKNVTVTFKKDEWDIKEGEKMPVKVTYTLCEEKTSDDTEINVPPILSVEIIEAKGKTNKRTGKVTVDCVAKGVPEGGIYKWKIGDKSANGKKVHVVLDQCEWDAKTGIIPISVKYIVAGKSVSAETTDNVDPLKFKLTMDEDMTKNINKTKVHLNAVFSPKAGGEVIWIKSGDCISKIKEKGKPSPARYTFNPIKPGKATITAKFYYCDKFIESKTCKVTIKGKKKKRK